MARYRGRRFAGFLLTAGLLVAGLFVGEPENYLAFSTALGLIYGAYLAGQSATDWKNGAK